MLYLYIISLLIIIFSLPSNTIAYFAEKKEIGKIPLSNLFFMIIFSLLLFLTMFRGKTIGNDTSNYMFYFELIAKRGISKYINFEVGYQFFNILVSKISNDPRAIVVATSLFSYLLTGIYFYKKCDKPFWAAVLFFPLFFSPFTDVIRMTCSISLLLWAYDSLEQKKLIKSVIWIVLAALFHITSLVFVPFAILMYKDIKFTSKLYGIFIFVFLCLVLMSNSILLIIRSMVERFGGRFADVSYLYGDRTSTGKLGVCFSISILAVIFFCYIKVVWKSQRRESTKWLFAFTLFFYVLSFVMNLFDRLALLFLFVLIVPVINEMIQSDKINKKNYFLIMTVVLVLSFLVKVYLRPEWNNLYPYEFMWN